MVNELSQSLGSFIESLLLTESLYFYLTGLFLLDLPRPISI